MSGRTNERAVGPIATRYRGGACSRVHAAHVASRPLLDDVDGLLDEIDQVLEVNAEEFVRGYVQKGGQ
jgi:ubiquitin-like protein Pup